MSEHESRIAWNFSQFEPNTVWAAQKKQKGERISSAQVKGQKGWLKKQTLSALARNIDPFSLISPAHDIQILDRKSQRKSQKGQFKFGGQGGYYGGENDCSIAHDMSSSLTTAGVIDTLNSCLVRSWQQCDRLISAIPADPHPFAKDLSNYISNNNELEIFVLTNNPAAVNRAKIQFTFYAVKIEDLSHTFQVQIEDDFKTFLGQQLPLSKYIVFTSQGLFYELQIHLSFIQSEEAHQQKLLGRLILKDNSDLFKPCLQNAAKLFNDFEFSAHGDYIEYPYKEAIAERRKFMKKESYSLVFQGGGAKGVAYVGAYSAIREMKKEGKSVPITSIMGSSAGGIIALAVSTNIDPYEVQKICYKMGTIPKNDRIDRKYLRTLGQKYSTDEKIDQEAQNMLNKLIELLNEYGVIQKLAIDELKKFMKGLDKKKLALLFKRVVEFVLASNESIGQIFDYQEGDFQEFNYLGLLLEGALMRGEAIHDIGSQCLVKYVLLNGQQYLQESHKDQLGSDLSRQLKEYVAKFDPVCYQALEIPLQQIVGENGTRTLFTIINKVFMVIDRNLAKFYGKQSQKFILKQRFAQALLKYFKYSSIYDPDEAQEIPDLYKILYNHHRLHPKSTNMGSKDLSQKEQRLKTITQILKNDHQIAYESISQVLAEGYFLDSSNFKLKEAYKLISLKELLANIFEHEGQQQIFQDKLFTRELAEIITETLTPQVLPHQLEPITSYKAHFEGFKKSVQKITLSAYYKLTKIELSCTSVDLENKVLRFFNHKTTPKLTVCRAVQMTGSFPVGFQAQSWKEEWGNYLIHYDNSRRQVLLKGHQFTDGGMLANFPIKYFDNDYIRDSYFSHVVNKSHKNEKHPYETIMLGFGLDRITAEQYTPSEGEIYRGHIQQKESAKAKILLIEALKDAVGYDGGIISTGKLIYKIKSLADAFRYPKPTEIEWKRVQQNLISDIPLFNFLSKLLSAYPRADRNLNLECFKDKIYRTKMISEKKAINQKTKQRIIELASLIDFDEKNKKKSVFGQKKSSWFGSLFGGKEKQVKENTDALNKLLQQAIRKTPLNEQILGKIQHIFGQIYEQQQKNNAKLSVEEAIKLKKQLKQTLFRVISNRMKLELSQSDLQWYTLQFFALRYSKKVVRSVNEISLKKFEDQISKQYYHIEEELPFEDFKKKMFEAELIKNYNQFDASRHSEEELKYLYQQKIEEQKRAIIEEKKRYIQKSLNDEDKKEYLNLPRYYVSEDDRYLRQYIFLSKLNDEDLDNANEFLRKSSVKRLFKHFQKAEPKQNEKENVYLSYITIKDLKAFYRRVFSRDTSKYTSKYDRVTFFERQQLFQVIQQQEEVQGGLNNDSIELAKVFNQTSYLDKKIRVNSLHSEHLYLKRSEVEKIQFIRILNEAFSNQQNREKIKAELFNLINQNPIKYNKILAKILFPDQEKVFKEEYFQELIGDIDLRNTLLHVLFNKNGVYYSENEHIAKIYQGQFEKFKRKKTKILQDINEELKQAERDRSSKGNSLRLQSRYFSVLLQDVNFKLLVKRVQSAKFVNYNLKNADLSSGMSTQTDRKYRESIVAQIDSEQQERAEAYDEMIKKMYAFQASFHIFELYLSQIRFILLSFCSQQENRDQPFIRMIEQTAEDISKSFIGIRQWMMSEFNRVIHLPVESIKDRHIEEVFTLDYIGFKNICQALLSIANKIQEYGRTEENPLQLSHIQTLANVISYVSYFDGISFNLPHFEVVWGIYMDQFKFKKHSKALLHGLNKQFSNTFVSKLSPVNPEIKVHLILEGSDLSNYYYAYYYELFNQFKQNLQKDHGQQKYFLPYRIEKNASFLKVRAVTTSSYHSIFGFLLAFNYSTCQLKNQMTEIREIAQHYESKELVSSYFDSYKWGNLSSQQYKQFWSYIKQEKRQFFKELQKLANKSLPNNNLTEEFREIRSTYEHEEDRIINYCSQILDDISKEVESIDKTVDPRYKALKISQSYAYNYTCNFQKQHEFSSLNQSSYELYLKVVQKLFNAYGSLLEAVITNAYSAQVKMKLPRCGEGFICKGFIVKQLLTTFKIKEYVIGKLKEQNLRENITLLEFFSQAPVKILLNFTTINVHKARLEFMNKNTLPNMPIWAAIVSSSCLPYFYNDFECPREWENPASDTASLYEFLVDEFFKSNVLDYKKAKYISGNIISSLPLELLTNETTLRKMFTFERESEPYLHVGYAFETNENNYKDSTRTLKRNYLEVGIIELFKLWKNSPSTEKFNKNCGKTTEKHKNKTYQEQSSVLSKLAQVKSSAKFTKYLGILTESNDNFILHTYWNKLIRLPIKIDTLDFHEITDGFLKKTYGVDVASGKTKNTVQRSYEITKYFERQLFGSEQNRYELNLRLTIIEKEAVVYGDRAYYAKLELLSHSKWNRNRYNNILVSYSTDGANFAAKAQTAMESEILWNFSESENIFLRFYFPKYAGQNQGIYSSICFSQLLVNIAGIIGELPLKNSYDYALNLYQPDSSGYQERQAGLKYFRLPDVAPFRKNLTPIIDSSKVPPLFVWKWLNGREVYEKTYIRHLQLP